MKFLKFDAYVKAMLVIAAGAAIAFFPQFISGLFYIAGAAVIIYNIIAMIVGIVKGLGAFVIPRSAGGILIGIAVTIFPKLLTFGLPVIIGVFLCVTGLERLLTAAEIKKHGGSWGLTAISGACSAILGIIFIFSPFSVSRTFIKLVGIAFIIAGIIMLIAAYRGKDGDASSVIDIDNFSVRDDDSRRIP